MAEFITRAKCYETETANIRRWRSIDSDLAIVEVTSKYRHNSVSRSIQTRRVITTGTGAQAWILTLSCGHESQTTKASLKPGKKTKCPRCHGALATYYLLVRCHALGEEKIGPDYVSKEAAERAAANE